ncbi:MAG: EamA family transporter [Chloroflexi bacterium]|nr:EamA family transporter [Chloroflexota bacterium]
MQKLQTSQPGDLWLVIAAASIWGTIGVATQAIYNTDTTTSLFINLGRMIIAAPVLLLLCWRVMGRSMFMIRRRDLGIMLLSGVLLALSQASYFAGIRATGVTISTLLTICIAPVIVTVLSVLLKMEMLSRRVILALVLALVGSVLLVGLQAPEGTHDDLLLGTLFALLSAVTYAGMIICGRFLAADYHPLQVTALNFVAGTITLILINLLSGIIIVHTAQGWLLILYLGLVPTALAYWLFQTGLRTVSATAASIISLLEPSVAALLAWLLFGETLAATGVLGGALLIVSILLLSAKRRRLVTDL